MTRHLPYLVGSLASSVGAALAWLWGWYAIAALCVIESVVFLVADKDERRAGCTRSANSAGRR